MEKHPAKLEGYETLNDVAEALENLRYDSLAEILVALRNRLVIRAHADAMAGRPQLAKCLDNTGAVLMEAVGELLEAWDICKSRMPPKLPQ
jgi:hypothetical protein